MKVIKIFDIEAGSTDNHWYRIRVKYMNELVEDIHTKTMKEAYDILQRKGYSYAKGIIHTYDLSY
jgi:hypothetical protein